MIATVSICWLWIGVVLIAGVLAARWAASGSGVGSFCGFGSPEAEFEFDGGGRTVVLDRGRRVRGVLRLPRPVRRAGTTARIRVSDSFGRLLVDRTVSAGSGRKRLTEIRVSLAIPAAIAQRHQLDIVVSSADGETFASRSEFVYRLPAEWDDYLPTLWHQPDPTNVGSMREMYLCGSQWLNNEPRLPDHFIEANYRYYVEHGFRNVFSPYHRRIKGEVAYYDRQARRAFLADRTNLRNLERNPCLSNPIIREEIDRLFAASARMHRDYRPLYYSIADEPGIADQAAAFDFCFSPWCREAFVKWLRKRYGTLGKLNRQWGTAHARWEGIRGGLTDEAIAAGYENYSAWCDHREFMDTVLCDAYRLARDAVRREDPKGRLGMAGGQGPQAVGGWDFWKLCQVFDVHETYYIGNNYELMRSFAPEGIPFHTSWGPNDPHPNAERHAIWYLFIHGDRGLLLIRPRGCEYLDAKGRYNANARRIMPLCRELSGGIGKLRIASRRVDDPIALYHSQANLRLHWIRQMRQVGLTWVHRTSSSERTGNRYVLLRESWVKVIEDNGLQYRFLCPPQVAAGGLKAYNALRGEGFKVLVLPEILAMSAAEAAAIRRFVRAGGMVIADRLPGTFDEHGKRRRKSSLADLFDDGAGGRAVLLGTDFLPYCRQRLGPGAGEARLKGLIGKYLLGALGRDRVTPSVTGRGAKPVTGVEVTVWRNGQAELIALHRNPQQRVDEVAPDRSNKRFQAPVTLTVRRKARSRWYDVRAGEPLATSRQVTVALGPWEPVFLLAAPPGRDDDPRVTVADGQIAIDPGAAAGLDRPVYHLAFLGPDGKERLVYRDNVVMDRSGGLLPLPIALNDVPGAWTLVLREVATGGRVNVPFEVRP